MMRCDARPKTKSKRLNVVIDWCDSILLAQWVGMNFYSKLFSVICDSIDLVHAFHGKCAGACVCLPIWLRDRNKRIEPLFIIAWMCVCMRECACLVCVSCSISGRDVRARACVCVYRVCARYGTANCLWKHDYGFLWFISLSFKCMLCLNAGTTLNVNQLSLKRTDSLRKWDFWCSNSFNRLFVFCPVPVAFALSVWLGTHIFIASHINIIRASCMKRDFDMASEIRQTWEAKSLKRKFSLTVQHSHSLCVYACVRVLLRRMKFPCIQKHISIAGEYWHLLSEKRISVCHAV